jgi:hypothetical protein
VCSSVVLVTGLVAGPAAAQDTRLRVVAPDAELTSGAQFGARVLMDLAVDGTQGWSFGVGHDPAELELLGAEPGALTRTAASGGPPQFLVINTAPTGSVGVTMAVVISFVLPITVDAGQDYEVLTMSYRVVADPTSVEPCEPIEAEIFFSSKLGEPPVSNVITVRGSSATPELVDDSVTVRCPGTLEITRCEGDPDNVYLEWTFGGVPTWDFLFLYRDGDFLAELAPDATSYTDKGLEPGDYHYTLVTFVVDDPANPVLIFAHCIATVIPLTVSGITPAIGYFLGGDTVTISGTAFTSAEMTRVFFVAGAEEPLELEVREVLSPNQLTAVTPRSPRLGLYGVRVENERGSAELPNAFEYGFIRGEVNLDLMLDLSDGVFILTYLFLPDAEAPACLDAADTTDDGLHDISDAIRIFGFLFLGGIPPEPPFPGPGRDPTRRDRLGCLGGPP